MGNKPVEEQSEAERLEVARKVLWHFGDYNLGWQAGSFETHLLRAIAVADQANLAKLTVAYPTHVEMVKSVQNQVWGLDWLRDMVMKSDRAAALGVELKDVNTVLLLEEAV